MSDLASSKAETLATQAVDFFGSYVSETRRRQARTWAMLYVNSMKCFVVSTITLSFLTSASKSSHISIFEYFLLFCSVFYLPLIAVYLIVACFADYLGLSVTIVSLIDDALKEHAFYGLSPTNAGASLYDPPKFLGYIKVNQNCETKEDGQKNLRIADALLVDGSLHYKLHPKKAAAVLGFNNVVPSSYVRFTRTLTEDIRLELVTVKQQGLLKNELLRFDKDVAKAMTRFCALSYEISKSTEGLEVKSNLEFTLLERFGFPSNIKCRLLFQDPQWPQNHAVAFWCPEDHWITVAFKGAVAWNIEKQMLNVCNDTVILENGAKCHQIVWQQLCGEDNHEIPYNIICKELDSIYQANWPPESKPVLFLTGQGIGGSIAELFQYLKLSDGRNQEHSIIGYTFGALGIGDETFCRDFNKRIRSYNGRATLFTVHNSLDLFAALPIGLQSPGHNVSLFMSWNVFLDTPVVHLTDLIFWVTRRVKAFISAQGQNTIDAIRGDRKALLSVIFWLWCNPAKPFCDRLPISYFRNLDDIDIRVVESEALSGENI